MIGGFTDHAANERTYLAWVRTGIALMALGLVIEKFNLFLMTIAMAAANSGSATPAALAPGRMGRYEGLALIMGGIGLVVLATVRFVRITRLLDDAQMHAASSVRSELTLSAVLVVLVAAYALYLAFGR